MAGERERIAELEAENAQLRALVEQLQDFVRNINSVLGLAGHFSKNARFHQAVDVVLGGRECLAQGMCRACDRDEWRTGERRQLIGPPWRRIRGLRELTLARMALACRVFST